MRSRLLLAALAVPLLCAQTRIMPGTPAKKEDPAPDRPQRPVIPQQPAVPDDGVPTIRATVNVVLVPTTVTDKGKTVNGLRPQDFKLYDNDRLQDINRDVAFLPLSMVICIQRTADVDIVLPKIRKVGNLMHDLLVGQDGEAAVVAFDHRIDLLQDFTNDPDKINAAVAKINAGGQNNRLNDAVQYATRMLRHLKDRRKVILLISQTMDRSSEVKVKEVATDLQLYNIDVFTLNINRLVTRLTEKPQVPRPDPLPPGARPLPGIASNDPTTTNQLFGMQGQGADFFPIIQEIFTATKAIFVKNPAEVYTQFTGGREYSFFTQADLERSLAAIGSEIRSQYILSYSPNNKLEGGYHKILVEVNRPDLKVRTRPGYWMAGVPD